MFAAPSSRKVAIAVAVFVVSLYLPLVLPFGAIHRARAQQEIEDEGEFSYRRDAGNGPARWGVVRTEWAVCSVGRLQSPIGLSDAVAALVDRPGRLGRSYRPAAASLVNRGHDIMVRFNSDPGGVLIDGVSYRLRQMHWHSPSEHAINGRRYDLELHMLHQSVDNRFAVVSQLYRIGRRRDRTIHRLERYIRRIARRKDHEELIDEVVNPRRPVSGSNVYYRYTGSFTTPPCTEGVTWVVANKEERAAASGGERQGRRLLLHLAGTRPRDGELASATSSETAGGFFVCLVLCSASGRDGAWHDQAAHVCPTVLGIWDSTVLHRL
ncbi:alpha carbonic anhydrase 2-like [Phragmites australis]|uniref:alpha carbonic anhydrase 2-like n=1 Tax=Phragmites australis TaxID=29695 RepID=UPI002D7A373B|nr:alpha carbonic anhydrase 2-like [Phragmites australis]